MFRVTCAALLILSFATPLLAESNTAVPAAPVIRIAKNPGPRTNVKPAGLTEKAPCDIGVIPVAGDLFEVKKVGLFAVFDQYGRTSVGDWALDDLIVSRVRAAAPGISVRRIAFSRQDLVDGWVSRLRDFDKELRDFARRVSANTRCERYVLVHRRGDGRVFGIGVEAHTIDDRVYLFALMHIRVYDGRTFELMAQGAVQMDDDSAIARGLLRPVGGPYQMLDIASFPTEPRDAASNIVLRDGVRALLTAGLDKTLPAMLQQ